MNIGIIGSGKWTKALATLVAEAGNHPRIGYLEKPLPGFPGSPNLASVAKESDLLFLAVPPKNMRQTILQAKLGPANHILIAARGLEPQTGNWLSDVITQESAACRIGVLGGPVLPDEVFHRRPTAIVAASHYAEVRKRAQRAIHSAICRLYTSSDLRGVELASSMVEALTIALGLADSLEQGIGVRGVIVTRGIAEVTRLGDKLGANAHSFAGLAGIGELVSCAPKHPGYIAGRDLGMGKTISQDRQNNLKAMLALASHHQVELPLIEAVTAIALGKLRPRLAIDSLMRREATAELI